MKQKNILKAVIQRKTILAIIAIIQFIYLATVFLELIMSKSLNTKDILYIIVYVVLICGGSIGIFRGKTYGWYISVGMYLVPVVGTLVIVVMAIFNSHIIVTFKNVLTILIYGGLLVFFFNEKTRSNFDFKVSRSKSVIMLLLFFISLFIVLSLLRLTVT